MDYYVLGHAIAHYCSTWIVNLWFLGDEEIEMFGKGIGNADYPWRERVQVSIDSFGTISLNSMKWFSSIPVDLIKAWSLRFSRADKVDGDAVNIFCQLVIPKLTLLRSLSLRRNPLGNGGAVEMLKHLHHCKIPLVRLDLADTGVGESDCAQLAPLIADSKLEMLKLNSNDLSSNSVASVMEGLLRNITMETVNMSGSNFSVMNSVSLATLLQQMKRYMSSLDISNCHINSEGAVHLARALMRNYSLRSLNISGNPIGDIGAAAFGDMLDVNTSLETLDISGCGITSHVLAQLKGKLDQKDIEFTI